MCDVPVYTKKGFVPCGHCSDCIGTKRQDWNNRLYYEAYYSQLTLFVTLTYCDEFIKEATVSDVDYQVLFYLDVTKFMKRLRKEIEFRYFYVGEYGEQSLRPHYHLLFFFRKKYDPVLLEKLFLDKWSKDGYPFGQISIFIANQAMLKYCTKDMLKELESFQHLPKEFRPRLFASKKLGCDYVNEFADWHRKAIIDRQKMAINGTSYGMPRYFRDKIFTKDERDIQRANRQDTGCDYHSLSEIQSREFIEEVKRKKALESQIIETKLRSRLKIKHFKKSL